MLDNFRFETFVDVHSNIFAEYLSSVIAKLPKENPEYRSTEERIEELYKEYPKVMAVLDTEKPSDLSEQECKALIEVLELRNRLSDMQQEAIYFRGCYDSVGYLKRQEFITENGGIGVELMPLLHSRRGGKIHKNVV